MAKQAPDWNKVRLEQEVEGRVLTLSAARELKLRGKWREGIIKRPIEWLWKPFLQRKAINLITGDPKTGKSTVVCELAAALSTGRALPCEEGQPPRPPMNVWLMNGEDFAEDTIAWRLDNQGVDPRRVLITDIGETLGRKEASEIKAEILHHGIDVTIIDPIQAWMGAEVDMHRANETRSWFGMFRRVAIETGCTFIFVRHRRKGNGQDTNMHAGLGSVDISAMARSELTSIKGKNNTFYLNRLQGNVGESNKTLVYTIRVEDERVNGDHGVLRWGTPTDKVEGMGGLSTTPRALGKAIEWLRVALAKGPRPASEVFQEAILAGYKETTIKRARKLVADAYQGTLADKQGWVWELLKAESVTVGASHGR